MVDWGVGRYENTAGALEPVAEHVVRLAGPAAGERILDIACGTGNAAFFAARAGGEVTGIDAAPRLIEVARSRAVADGLDASFVVGDAQALPFADSEFDVVLSIFGVIFVDDAACALAEALRVLRPGGRAFITAWLPEGPISEAVGIWVRAVADATGPAPPRFAWHDIGAVRELADRHGAAVDFEDGQVAFTGDSPKAYLHNEYANHPMFITSRAVLERAGTLAEVHTRTVEAIRDGNEDPEAFRVTSRYRIARLRRAG